MLRLFACACLCFCAWSAVLPYQALADACAPGELASAVDEAGEALRAFNAEAQPKLKSRLDKLRAKKGWTAEEAEEKALAYLEDERIASLDTKSNDLLTKIDALGRPADPSASDCSSIAAVRATGAELLGVMKEKLAYTLAKLDKELGVEPPPAAPPAVADKPKAASPPATPAPPAREAKPALKVEPLPPPSKGPAADSWQTAEETPDQHSAPGTPYPLPPDAFMPAEDGYSIQEIRDATKGFFGTISTNLATVLEHAFSVAGRPTAYVLGNEGGGAFLAGLRYGEGMLYMRQGGRRKVYWHGPSIGTDVGAAGSRTLFLIYKLDAPDDLFRVYSGVDGSAYLVGGIGFTLMKGGKVVLAPIRTGLGLRIGANIGYVRFTPRPTWNPF